MDGDKETLASELLHEIKSTSRRWFVLFIITLIILFATNLCWLYAWNLPYEETTTTVTQDSGENGDNNYIGNDGDINGKTSDTQENN